MKNNKGITLVALVITVIVLLILAVVAITMITGEDGLFAKANTASHKYNEAAKNEATELDILTEEIDNLGVGAANANVAISLENSTYAFAAKATINITENEKELNYNKSKYVFTNSQERVGNNSYDYTHGNLTGTTTVVEKALGPGNWYLHVLVTDTDGNKLEQVSEEVVTIVESIDYNYTGKMQSVALLPGKYKLECWGAQGGTMESGWTGIGGRGGYAKGDITIQKNTTLYVSCGQQGQGYNSARTTHYGGWNGGGYCYQGASGGGGATDISLYGTDNSTSWNTTEHLYSRIIVAGGGAGSNDHQNGGHGGGLTGGTGVAGSATNGAGASQTAGGAGWIAGSFGVGAGSSNSHGDGGAGGGGWYGGGKANGNSVAGGGGSGYVYTVDSEVNYPEDSLLNSGYYLTNAETIGGNEVFKAPNGEEETGHAGHGSARITNIN